MNPLAKIKKGPNLHDILARYLDNFLSQNTRDAYVNDLNQFTLFMKTEFPEVVDPTQIQPTHIIRFAKNSDLPSHPEQ